MSYENFLRADKDARAFEGGYANHTADRGGETWCGWTRNFNPEWPGWVKIDAATDIIGNGQKWHTDPGLGNAAKTAKLNAVLFSDPELREMLLRGYHEKYWLGNCCDEIPDQIARKVYYTCVNGGGASILQRTVNALIARGAIPVAFIDIDGDIGPLTVAALRAVLSRYGEQETITTFQNIQRHIIDEDVRKNPSQAVFRSAWENSINYRG